jgi:cytidine deaminase
MKKPQKTPSKLNRPRRQISVLDQGFRSAFSAQKKSYSPYSGKKIGAAIRLKSGEIFSGCNIENASYGATVCAERVALWKAVSEKKKIEITDVYVVSPKGSPPWPPCGMCRQVLAEFCTDSTLIHCSNSEGETHSIPFDQVFPGAFRKTYLQV